MSKKSRSTAKQEIPRERSTLFEQLAQLEDFDIEEANYPTLPPPTTSRTTPLTKCSSLAQELELAKLQKEKLQLELELLRLKQGTTPPDDTATKNKGKDAKKRTIECPQDFVPGMSSSSADSNSLDMAGFIAGYIAMIKPYDAEAKETMYALLELISSKAIRYSWSSVRGFYCYIARQVEQRRLEWSQLEEIRNSSTTFFKHSDLRSTTTKSNASRQTTSTNGDKTAEKGCQAWNYKGACVCDSSSDSYATMHVCRVCKSTEHVHPMLNCPKRRMPIPGQ
ncbi:uncharacterized protein LOC116305533 [Actinia tenebrosa]|uniref:Uncharacterized protein LOC116305533 n=1 Tax=Actinia tenebrosa TaxID=6105 RepID=A0A6P8IWB9_ACTTE|nr:uncharacterized protein LOC116305533 [Actinia tenebrosa]